MMKLRYKEQNSQQGFTLMELLVASSIFVGVMTVAVMMFVSAMQAQRKIVAIQAVEENARFMLEFVAKDIRVSSIQTANGQNLQALQIIRNSDGETVNYVLDGTNLTRDVTGDGIGAIPINGQDVAVTGSFSVRGSGASDGQPLVTIVLDVQRSSSRVGEGARVQLQTSIAERGPDRRH